MAIREGMCAAALIALAVSACGEGQTSAEAVAASVDEATTDAVAGTSGEDTAEAQAPTAEATPTPTRKALTPIPAAFHGKWGMLGDCSDPMVITAGGIESRRAPPLKSVKILGSDTIELDREQDPKYPDQDQRFGLSVSSDDMLVYSAPRMSSLRLERCGKPAAKKQTTAASSGGGLPASFLGQWDGGEYGGCDGLGPDAKKVEPRRIVSETDNGWKLSNIDKIGPSSYRAKATYFAGDYVGQTFGMTLTLKDGGETLVLDLEGQGRITYEHRCG